MRTTTPRPRPQASRTIHLPRIPVVSRRAFLAAGALLAGSAGFALFSAPPSAPAGTTDPRSSAPITPEPSAEIDANAAPSAANHEALALPRDDWRLTLVNPWHPVDPDYTVPLAVTQNGFQADERCIPDLERMLNACSAAGCNPFICSAYRTHEMQAQLFEQKVQSLRGEGLLDEEARAEAATVVAVPGTSEHQLGLALDIVDFNNQNLTDQQATTPTQRWLMAHSWEYGFIFRYPAEKTSLTGIIYEPWHYRYVGREAAETITNHALCLEEYLA